MIRQNPIDSRSVLRIGGAFTLAFSVVMAILVLFVIPVACSFLGGLELLILGSLFIVGAIAFVIGRVLSTRRKT